MKKMTVLLTAVLLVSLLSGCAYGTGSTIGIIGGADGPASIIVGEEQKTLLAPEKAEEIALTFVGLTPKDVQMGRTTYELDDLVPKYEVSFRQGGTEFEFEIHAVTGDILSYDYDD